MLTPKGKLVRGQASSGSGEFIFRKYRSGGPPDGELVHSEAVNLGLEVQEGEVTGTAFKAPLVDDADDSYKLTHVLMAEGAQVPGSIEDWIVWPRKAELTSKDVKNAKPLLAGFRFQVKQDGRATPWAAPKTYETTGDTAKVEFPLELGFPFTLEVVPPCKIENPQPQSGRKRSVEFSVSFLAVFLSPPRLLGDGSINTYYGSTETANAKALAIKQYVNLTSAVDGQDGRGSAVLIEAGVKGDVGLPDPDKIGKAGRFVFIKVGFTSAASGTLGKRNDPPPGLLALPALAARTEVTAMESYTGKVELKEAGGTGRFKIELGLAGGDVCKVEIGGTEGVVDQTLTFTNWRRLEYELMVPDCMVPDLSPDLDFPDSVRQAIVRILEPAFIEYVRIGTKRFGKIDAAPLLGAWQPANYLPRKGHGGEGYMLSSHAALYGKKNNNPVAFTPSPPSTTMQFMLCDTILSDAGSDTPDFTITEQNQRLNFIPLKYLVVEYAANGNKETSINFSTSTWTAQLPDAAFPLQPVLVIAPQVMVADSKPKTIKVRETRQNLSVDLLFDTSWGTAITTLASSELAKLDHFFSVTLNNPGAIFAANNEVRIEIHAEQAEPGRKLMRYNAVLAAINERFAAKMPACVEKVNHPGWDSASLSERFDFIVRQWISYETLVSLRVNIPSDTLPGKLLGAKVTAQRCPIVFDLYLRKTQTLGGFASEDFQTLALPQNTASMGCVVCHELGHSMGMTIMAADNIKEPPGMTAAKHVDQGGVYYLNGPVAGGGIRLSHRGPHCATGLGADMSKGSYDGLEGTCVMYGRVTKHAPTANFCTTCLEYLKGRNLSDIRKKWETRANAKDY
ncbi:hypothetical protein HX867_23420 [Pseudomonas gingeri]|uniref:hypothetical protein n=1 Tax=Pseudomonas gingeri TaxID=117681 RepID=UPI0015A01E71|nr:hypothetical protein [Pseudomonas gingeri]NVZ65062.1 hypothetical protein [Pseudomonas gingeri]NVZ77928.1 hypothetical protein [Pseudomonas gingeri]